MVSGERAKGAGVVIRVNARILKFPCWTQRLVLSSTVGPPRRQPHPPHYARKSPEPGCRRRFYRSPVRHRSAWYLRVLRAPGRDEPARTEAKKAKWQARQVTRGARARRG